MKYEESDLKLAQTFEFVHVRDDRTGVFLGATRELPTSCGVGETVGECRENTMHAQAAAIRRQILSGGPVPSKGSHDARFPKGTEYMTGRPETLASEWAQKLLRKWELAR